MTGIEYTFKQVGHAFAVLGYIFKRYHQFHNDWYLRTVYDPHKGSRCPKDSYHTICSICWLMRSEHILKNQPWS